MQAMFTAKVISLAFIFNPEFGSRAHSHAAYGIRSGLIYITLWCGMEFILATLAAEVVILAFAVCRVTAVTAHVHTANGILVRVVCLVWLALHNWGYSVDNYSSGSGSVNMVFMIMINRSVLRHLTSRCIVLLISFRVHLRIKVVMIGGFRQRFYIMVIIDWRWMIMGSMIMPVGTALRQGHDAYAVPVNDLGASPGSASQQQAGQQQYAKKNDSRP